MYATGLAVNDALVAALMLGAFLLAGRPAGRGALVGLAAAVKFSPAVLLLVLGRGGGRRAAAVAALACAGAFAFPFVGHVPDGGLREIWDATLGFQMTRTSAFSPWGQHAALHPLQLVAEALALAVLAAVALLPGRGDLTRLAAMAAAALIAVQLPAIHWYYPYVVWFVPFALVALLTPRTSRRASTSPPSAMPTSTTTAMTVSGEPRSPKLPPSAV